MLETSAITSKLLALSGRNIRVWVTELDDFISYVKVLREYLIHRSKVHDIVIEASNRRKDQEVARYNQEIILATHHINNLVILY